jgi:hypothetical protein
VLLFFSAAAAVVVGVLFIYFQVIFVVVASPFLRRVFFPHLAVHFWYLFVFDFGIFSAVASSLPLKEGSKEGRKEGGFWSSRRLFRGFPEVEFVCWEVKTRVP